MTADVVLLPGHLSPADLAGRTAVVSDVLRATTSMAAALAAGVKEIRIFGEIESAREAAGRYDGPRLLCGESACLPPAGFDLGNSPGAFDATHAGRTMFMCTTNGTRAIIAAQSAAAVLTGALVNAAAAAREAARIGRDVTLLCAGTNGRVAMEDVLGAGAVLRHLVGTGRCTPASDVARMALRLFDGSRNDLRRALAESRGGMNVADAGLGEDVDFAARLDSTDAVGRVVSDPLRVVRV